MGGEVREDMRGRLFLGLILSLVRRVLVVRLKMAMNRKR